MSTPSTQTQTAEGFTPAAETSVVVPEDDTIELPLVNARAETEGQEQEEQEREEDGEQIAPVDEGQVIVTIRAEDGAPLPGACVATGRWLIRHLRLRRRGG